MADPYEGIYRALDLGNQRLALQLCAKQLKKSPSSPLLKALKAVALMRDRRMDEATELATALSREPLADAHTVQLVVMVLDQAGDRDSARRALEQAAARAPHDEELGNHLFMWLVRAGGPSEGTLPGGELRAVAARLQKQFTGEPKYCFWVVLLLWHEATAGGAGDATAAKRRATLLALALRMLERAHSDSLLKSFEELHLYQAVLCDAGQPAAALALVDGPLGAALARIPAQRARLALGLAREVGDAAGVWRRGQALVAIDAGEWAGLSALADAAESHSALLAALEPLPAGRGTFLASLASISRHGGGSDAAWAVATAFFAAHGRDPCFFEDIREHVALLRGAAGVAGLWDSAAGNVSKMCSVARLHVALGGPGAPSVPELVASYLGALAEGLGSGLARTDRHPADNLLVTASALACGGGDRALAAALLEVVLENSPSNHHARLLLARLMLLLGAQPRALEAIDALNIKQLQLDSMSFVVEDALGPLGSPSTVLQRLRNVLSIHRANERETPEMLCQAFRFGTYSKIPEFLRFQRRLARSVQRASTAAQLAFSVWLYGDAADAWVPALQSVPGLDKIVDGPEWEDNRDWGAFFRLDDKPAGSLGSLEGHTRPVPLLGAEDSTRVAALRHHRHVQVARMWLGWFTPGDSRRAALAPQHDDDPVLVCVKTVLLEALDGGGAAAALDSLVAVAENGAAEQFAALEGNPEWSFAVAARLYELLYIFRMLQTTMAAIGDAAPSASARRAVAAVVQEFIPRCDALRSRAVDLVRCLRDGVISRVEWDFEGKLSEDAGARVAAFKDAAKRAAGRKPGKVGFSVDAAHSRVLEARLAGRLEALGHYVDFFTERVAFSATGKPRNRG